MNTIAEMVENLLGIKPPAAPKKRRAAGIPKQAVTFANRHKPCSVKGCGLPRHVSATGKIPGATCTACYKLSQQSRNKRG